MPSCDPFRFNVCVNNKSLKEYTLESDSECFYVESDLYSEVSYYIEEAVDKEGNKQKYPVTPFTVHGFMDNMFDVPLYLKLCVDGHQVWMKPFPPCSRQQFKVNGYKQQSLVRELLFTLPRMDEDDSSLKKKMEKSKDMIGTISMECIEAIAQGTFTTWGTAFLPCSTGELSDCPTFTQSSKKDGNIGVAAREGRGLFQVQQNHQQSKVMTRYQLGSRHFGGVVLKYRPRYTLQDLGITDEAWSANARCTTNGVGTKSMNQDITDPLGKHFSEDVADKFRKMSCHSPTGSGNKQNEVCPAEDLLDTARLFCLSPRAKGKVSQPSETKLSPLSDTPPQTSKLNTFSPSDNRKLKMEVNSPSESKHSSYQTRLKVKQELLTEDTKQYRMIEIDDDIQILEEVDDDVVWMGDESCCFLDVPEPDVSMVDLSEDI